MNDEPRRIDPEAAVRELERRPLLASDPAPLKLCTDDQGVSLSGSCSRCQRVVDNHDELHRVSVLRGDITHQLARPMGPR